MKQIFVSIDEDRLVPPLKEMAHPVLSPVDPASVTKLKVLDDLRKRNFGDLAEEVHVIRHKTESEDRVAESLHPFLKEQVKTVPVLIAEENVLPCVPTQDHVVKSAREIYALSPGH